VETFLDRHQDFQLEDLRSIFPLPWHSLIDSKGFLRTYPQMVIPKEGYRLDGFFAARMKKQ
jgi:16S rRNA C967 or C1407 C5-methylase (RsmB/RsmF family)